jgi:hypothetical protein
MKLKQFIAGAALLMAASLSQATVYTVSPSPMVNGSVYNENVLLSHGTFEDMFNFTIDSQGSGQLISIWAAISITDPSTVSQTSVLNIDNFSVSLWHDLATDVQLSTDAINSMSLADGNYYLKVSGTANGAMGGNYNVTLAAVPEPQTLTLLGLGILGLAVSRRKVS